MEQKLQKILQQLSEERELSYRKGSVLQTDKLDCTSPLSNVIIECFDETLEVDSGQLVGTEKFKNGGEYKGNVGAEHVMHGSGQYQWLDGLLYKGDFSNCHITGEGTYEWPDGSCYAGEVLDGLRNGWGCYKCANSSVVYTGAWKDGKRHGKGKIVYDEKGTSYYDGEWKDHVRHGEGCRRYSSGNVYKGEWHHDKPHGMGSMYWHTTNEQYTGQWRCGIQDGHGEHVWFIKQADNSQYPLCNRYVGNWSRGLRHGFGTFFYASGAVYEGEWHHNKKHGRGRYISQTGVVTDGLFREDQLVGQGVDRPITPISRLTAGEGTGAHAGGDHKGSGCGSDTAVFVEYIKTLLPDELPVEEEFQQVYGIVLLYISQLKTIYHFYSNLGREADSDQPYSQKSLSRMQLWQLLKDCHLCQIGCNLIEVDKLLLLQSCSPTSNLSYHDPSSTYLMREFLQLLVSISCNLFWTSTSGPLSGRLAHCLDKLLKCYILKYACKVGGLFYQPTNQVILSTTHRSKCWEVYQIIGSKGPVSMREFLVMMNDCRLIGNYLSSTDIIDYIASDNSQASADPPHHYNLEILITFLEFCEALIACGIHWQSRRLNHPTVMSPIVPTLKVESTHSHMSGGGSDPSLSPKSSHGLTGNKHLAQVLHAHQANSGISVESASSLSGKRAAATHAPAVAPSTTTSVGEDDSKQELSSPLKIPSKHSLGITLSPIEETKSTTSDATTPTSGPADGLTDKESLDHTNAPNEQDEIAMCREALKVILEEFILPHYGLTVE